MYGRKCLNGKGKGSESDGSEDGMKAENGGLQITSNSSSADVSPMGIGVGQGAESRALLIPANGEMQMPSV